MKLPANLTYSHDDEPGITRRKRGKGWSFHLPDGSTIKDSAEKARLLGLGLPPAYTDVWYCLHPNGHLQARGYDSRGRKQCRYHQTWTEWRSEQKFEGLLDFGLALPKLRNAIDYSLSGDSLNQDRILGAVMKLLDRTAARIGNEAYYQQNGTAGLTTLRKKHVVTEDKKIHLSYRAKSGKDREFHIYQPTLAKIISRMQELPGQRLFQYRSGENTYPIESSHINEWLKEKSGIDGISSKYFRTWHASHLTLDGLMKYSGPDTNASRVRYENEILQSTSQELGHRPPVCRNHYIHPEILTRFREASLTSSIAGKAEEIAGLSQNEENLIHFLRKLSAE